MGNMTNLAIRMAIGLSILALAATGAGATALPGPDGFGYLGFHIQNAGLRDVSATGTEVILTDDELSGAIPIGFTFNFYGVDYTEAFISSNGFVSLDPNSDSLCCSGTSLPSASNPFPIIAAFWDDLDPEMSGQVRYETRGAAGSRDFIVGFYGVAHHDSSVNASVTFEIILHEGTNDIEIFYGGAQQGGDDSAAGIQNEDATIGLEILFIDTSTYDDGEVIFYDEGFLLTTSEPTCAGRPVTILGGSGPEVLVGTPGDDVIIAGGGPDVVLGGDGDDVICGGPGDDSLDGGAGNDVILGGSGNDTIRGGPGSDRIRGGRGADVCDGGKGSDRTSDCELTRRVP